MPVSLSATCKGCFACQSVYLLLVRVPFPPASLPLVRVSVPDSLSATCKGSLPANLSATCKGSVPLTPACPGRRAAEIFQYGRETLPYVILSFSFHFGVGQTELRLGQMNRGLGQREFDLLSQANFGLEQTE